MADYNSFKEGSTCISMYIAVEFSIRKSAKPLRVRENSSKKRQIRLLICNNFISCTRSLGQNFVEMSKSKEYLILFIGLKLGKHHFVSN
jgi:hypothetical protein